MKNMKRLVALLFIIILTFNMFGCSNEDDKETAQETTSEKKNKVELSNLTYDLTIDADTDRLNQTNTISDLLYGLFIEDINFAVDGGMYAEMVKNGSFEYGDLAANKNKHGWTPNGEALDFSIINGESDKSGLNNNNMYYARITNTGTEKVGIGNSGYLAGLSIEEGAEYKFTGYIKSKSKYKGKVYVNIENNAGVVYAKGEIDAVTDKWMKYEVSLKPNATINKGLKLYIRIEKGEIEMDMISLFPKDTYKGRENGIRKDIGEYFESLNPSFVRFPGGCLIEGNSFETMYSWKDSIGDGMEFEVNGAKAVGDVAARPLGTNGVWNRNSSNPYYMTYGIGFYEYFLLSEDLDALAVPVVNAGMTCPIQSGNNYKVVSVNSEEFQQYIQDALDLAEFCRGDASTKWGAVRIAMGHEEKFELKYIGIGNEQWQEEYFIHYEKFKEAFEQAAKEQPEIYGDIELIVANGPMSFDQYAWNKIAVKGDDYAGLVDEHYYETPSWFLSNVDRYASYDRNSVPVFLGEYAAKSNNMQAALAEAAFMTGLEENADIVRMACYAPLFGNNVQTQWTPDLIWYSNDALYGSINFYVQKMYANNIGTKTLNTTLTQSGIQESVLSGKIGLGTWQTSAEFDDLKVISNPDGEELYSNDFENGTVSDWQVQGGRFSIEDGVLKQSNVGSPKNQNTGDVAYIGDKDWSNYTLTVKAKKTGGDEGFLIPIAVQDKDNCVFWNIGGWGNTVNCLQIVSNGSKSEEIAGTKSSIALTTGKEYELKVILNGNNIKCFIDGKQVIDYDYKQSASVYQTTSIDENGDMIIKIVNVSESAADINVKIDNADQMQSEASLTLLSAETDTVANTKSNPELVSDAKSKIQVSENFNYNAPKYSVSIIRISNQ